MPNQTDPKKTTGTTNVPPVSVQHTDLPPLPDFMAIPTPKTSPASPPLPVTPDPQATPPDLPPMVSTPKKRFGRGKIIATILGLLLLVGGVGAGVVLTQQQQIFQPKAYSCSCNQANGQANPGWSCPVGQVAQCNKWPGLTYYSCGCVAGGGGGGGGTPSCSANGSPCAHPEDCCTKICAYGICSSDTSGQGGGGGVPPPSCANLGEPCNASVSCCSGKNITCNNDTKSCSTTCPTAYCIGTDGRHASYSLCANNENQVNSCTASDGRSYYCCKPAAGGGTPTCNSIGYVNATDICVGNVQTGNCYQGGLNNQYACYKLQGNPGKMINGSGNLNDPESNGKAINCTCPSDYPYHALENGGDWCFKTSSSCGGAAPYDAKCSFNPQQCSSGTPPPGTTPPTAPMCVAVSAYDPSWSLLSPSQLSALTTATQVKFCVSGSAPSGTFDKAQFTISGVQQPETTTVRPGSTDFCQSYTILATDRTVNVTAKIHHSTLGWY